MARCAKGSSEVARVVLQGAVDRANQFDVRSEVWPGSPQHAETRYQNVPVSWVSYGEQMRVISRERRSTMGRLTFNGAGSGQSTFSLDGVTANHTGSNNRELASRRSVNSPAPAQTIGNGPSPLRRDPDG